LFVLHYNPALPAKNIVTGQRFTKPKLERAKELRREMTPAEKLLWQEVRAKKLGVRFRPPPPLSGTSLKSDKVKSECGFKVFIVGFGGGWVGVVDFYCHPVKITRGLRQVRAGC